LQFRTNWQSLSISEHSDLNDVIADSSTPLAGRRPVSVVVSKHENLQIAPQELRLPMILGSVYLATRFGRLAFTVVIIGTQVGGRRS
jgi:hypothetical protein